MIVRERPSGLRLFLVLRGSVLQRIRLTLLFNILLATFVTIAHGNLFSIKITLTAIPPDSSSSGTSCFLVFIVLTDRPAYAGGGLSVYTKFCTPSDLGHRPIGEVEPPELLRACERVQDRDAVESAHRLLTTASGVWQFAIAKGYATRDIVPA